MDILKKSVGVFLTFPAKTFGQKRLDFWKGKE